MSKSRRRGWGGGRGVWLLIAAVTMAGCGREKARGQREGATLGQAVFADAQRTWNDIFAREGAGEYKAAKLEEFRGKAKKECGAGGAAYYCGAEGVVYADRALMEELERRSTDAAAYVVVRLEAEHVQRLLGIDERLKRAGAKRPEERAELEWKKELQAECFAGLWARFTERKDLMDAERAEEAMEAAEAAWKKQNGPKMFLAERRGARMEWFRRGLKGEEMGVCNTFALIR